MSQENYRVWKALAAPFIVLSLPLLFVFGGLYVLGNSVYEKLEKGR